VRSVRSIGGRGTCHESRGLESSGAGRRQCGQRELVFVGPPCREHETLCASKLATKPRRDRETPALRLKMFLIAAAVRLRLRRAPERSPRHRLPRLALSMTPARRDAVLPGPALDGAWWCRPAKSCRRAFWTMLSNVAFAWDHHRTKGATLLDLANEDSEELAALRVGPRHSCA